MSEDQIHKDVMWFIGEGSKDMLKLINKNTLEMNLVKDLIGCYISSTKRTVTVQRVITTLDKLISLPEVDSFNKKYYMEFLELAKKNV